MGSSIITTMNKYEEDGTTSSGLIDPTKRTGTLKEYQTVVAVGSYVRDIKVGDLVCVDPRNYAVKKYKENSIKSDLMENEVVRYNFNTIDIDGVPHLMLRDTDVSFIVEEWEVMDIEESETEKPSDIITPALII